MYRGTTPTITFTLPFDCNQITLLNVCFSQDKQIVLEKTLEDCIIKGNTLSVNLTEKETLMFNNENGTVEMQLRVGIEEARMASNIMIVPVKRILKDGYLE